jgi:hypothetical protein
MCRTKVPIKHLKTRHQRRCFSGENMEVNHLRIFGYPIFLDVPKEKRTKLDPSGKNGIFFGYNDT